jgi:hypothetical protein
MPIKVDLRATAEIEADRIRSLKAKAGADSAPLHSGGGVFTVLRRSSASSLIRSAAVFFTRTRLVDGTGRLVEDLMVPVEVRATPHAALRKRRDIGLHARKVFAAYHAAVRTVALAEVARRISVLATDYGRGLERARERESRLAELAANHAPERVQAGLFDRRALQDRDRSVHFHAAMSNQHRQRRQALDASCSLIIAQQSEIVLLLIIFRGA